jgi:hypothetical protein
MLLFYCLLVRKGMEYLKVKIQLFPSVSFYQRSVFIFLYVFSLTRLTKGQRLWTLQELISFGKSFRVGRKFTPTASGKLFNSCLNVSVFHSDDDNDDDNHDTDDNDGDYYYYYYGDNDDDDDDNDNCNNNVDDNNDSDDIDDNDDSDDSDDYDYDDDYNDDDTDDNHLIM